MTDHYDDGTPMQPGLRGRVCPECKVIVRGYPHKEGCSRDEFKLDLEAMEQHNKYVTVLLLLEEARDALADDPPYLTVAQAASRGDLLARIDAALPVDETAEEWDHDGE